MIPERLSSMSTGVRIGLGAAVTAILALLGVVWLRDDPASKPARLRERIVLTDDVSSELTGAIVSLRGEQPMLLDIAVGGETCTFELRRPLNHYATVGGDTWAVIVRRVEPDQRRVNVRVDRVLDSAEPDGCRELDRGADG